MKVFLVSFLLVVGVIVALAALFIGVSALIAWILAFVLYMISIGTGIVGLNLGFGTTFWIVLGLSIVAGIFKSGRSK